MRLAKAGRVTRSTKAHLFGTILAPLLVAAAPTPALGLEASPPAAPSAEEQSLLAIRQLDGRVATIGHRLAVAAADLCNERQWLPGLTIHHLSQYGGAYREAAARAFGLERGPAVLALAAEGPAQTGGLQLDDVIAAVDGAPLPEAPPDAERTFDQVESMTEALERAFADGEAVFTILRDGAPIQLAVRGEQGCASRFQLIPSRELNARADGRYVQLTTAIAEYVHDEDELAWVLAHEFAHNVLRHRARLDEAGIQRGILRHFGRNARLIRDTEIEADRLSIHLLDRAGYDPRGAVRFWWRFGRHAVNFLGSPTHPNWRRRVATFEEEIARIAAARAEGREPEVPAPLAPLD